MWKSILHTTRYSYYDLLMLSVAGSALSHNQIGLWLSVCAFWLVSVLFVQWHYSDKK